MKKNTPAFDPAALPELSALVGDQAALMASAKLCAALARDPAALLATAVALLDGPGSSNTSLAALGLDPAAVGQAACKAMRRQDCDAEQIGRLVQGLMLSKVHPSEQRIIERLLAELQEERIKTYQRDPLADFIQDFEPVSSMLKGPGATVWLASPVANFSYHQAWRAMENRPDLAASAIANPRGFLHGSAVAKVDPADWMDLALAPPALLADYLRRVSELDSSEQALYRAEQWLTSEELRSPQGAPHRAALLPFFQKEMSAQTDSRGEVFTGLAQAAFLSGDTAFAQGIARMADSVVLGDGPCEPLFVFHPSGSGGIDFPTPSIVGPHSVFGASKYTFSLPTFTWADYIVAYGAHLGPDGSSARSNSRAGRNTAPTGSETTYSAALDFLADSMAALGLDQPVIARGSHLAMRDMAEIALRFPKKDTKDASAIAALADAVNLRLALPQTGAPSDSLPRPRL